MEESARDNINGVAYVCIHVLLKMLQCSEADFASIDTELLKAMWQLSDSIFCYQFTPRKVQFCQRFGKMLYALVTYSATCWMCKQRKMTERLLKVPLRLRDVK